jgi:hypothetical protein
MMLTSDCVCSKWTIRDVEIEISDYKIEFRCGICKSRVRWWDENTRPKIMPYKREWSYEECLAMR